MEASTDCSSLQTKTDAVGENERAYKEGVLK
jgi:hypothetical protein